MDPVSALSLSCNVLQLIENAVTTGKVIYNIYKTGKVEGVEDAKQRLRDLDELVQCATKLSQQPFSQATNDSARQAASQILQHCSQDAEALKKDLEKMETSHRGIKRHLFALKAVATGSADKVDRVKSRLERSREWLNSSMLPIIASDVQLLLSKQEIAFDSLDLASRNMLQKMTTGFKDLETSIQDSKAQIFDRLDDGFAAQSGAQVRLNEQSASEHRREQSRAQLLASLRYSEMNLRINSISDHSEGTFDWILNPMSCEDSEGNFASWLVSSEPHFWIQGKPGSGKSTLMKRIWHDDYTAYLLSISGNVDSSVVIKHSFWLATENNLRKSYKGMLCSLIHEMLSSRLPSIDWLLIEKPRLRKMHECGDWAEASLEETLFDLLSNRVFFGRVCILLDALDEIGSPFDKQSVFGFIKNLSRPSTSHVKLCTSSRPDRPWSEYFQSVPHLELEHLTRKDIEIYAREYLGEKLPDEDQKPGGMSTKIFLDNFVFKSEGVFLWAHLAIHALLEATADAGWEEIQEHLAQLPRGMMPLYSQILARRAQNTDSVKAEAATYFQLCLGFEVEDSEDQSTLLLHQALLTWKSMFQKEKHYCLEVDEKTFLRDYMRLEKRIQDVSAGLLRPKYGPGLMCFPYEFKRDGWPPRRAAFSNDPRNRPHGDEIAADKVPTVQFEFFHRTIVDFLIDAPEGREFMSRSELSPSRLLLNHIDAEMLRCRLWYRHPDTFRVIGLQAVIIPIIESIAQFQRNNSTSEMETQVLEAVRRLKDAVKAVIIPEQDHDDLESTISTSSVVFDLARRTDARTLDTVYVHIAHDIEGLLLESGCDLWFAKEQLQYLDTGPTISSVMTDTYKDYLLLCATRGCLPQVAHRLIESGADFYADHYLPLTRPEKRSAAGELLIISSNRRCKASEPGDLCLWVNTVSCCEPRVQYQIFHPHWKGGERAGLLGFFDFSSLDSETTFVLDVYSNLNLWLRNAASNGDILPPIRPHTCIGFLILNNRIATDYSIQPFFANSWAGFSHLWGPDDQFMFPHAIPASCSHCLADAGDGFWQLIPNHLAMKLHHRGCEFDENSDFDSKGDLRWRPTMREPIPLYSSDSDSVGYEDEEPSHTTSTESARGTSALRRTYPSREACVKDLRKHAAEMGFYKSPDDPAVAQVPIPMFENISDFRQEEDQHEPAK